MCGCHQAQRLATAHGRDGGGCTATAQWCLAMAVTRRSHCCDLQTCVIVSGDVEYAATSAKRRSDGSVLCMAAMVEIADMLRTRFFFCWFCESCEMCKVCEV